MSEPVVTTTMFTDAERAAWEVAVDRGLPIEAADLRAMLAAAVEQIAAEADRLDARFYAYCEHVPKCKRTTAHHASFGEHLRGLPVPQRHYGPLRRNT